MHLIIHCPHDKFGKIKDKIVKFRSWFLPGLAIDMYYFHQHTSIYLWTFDLECMGVEIYLA